MEFLDQFGIQPVLLAAQIINFLILLYILKRILYKPVLDMLQKRKQEIQRGLQDAQSARLLMEKTEAEERTILKKAQAQSKKMLDETKEQSQAILKQSEQQAKKQTEQMITHARTQIKQEAEEAEDRIVKNVTKISIQILEQSLEGMVSPKAQQEILEKTVRKLEKKAN